MKLSKGDTIVTAWATTEVGPGWANAPIWALVREARGVLREECIQPDDQTPEMRTLHPFSQLAHSQLTHAVRSTTTKPRKGTTP